MRNVTVTRGIRDALDKSIEYWIKQLVGVVEGKPPDPASYKDPLCCWAPKESPGALCTTVCPVKLVTGEGCSRFEPFAKLCSIGETPTAEDVGAWVDHLKAVRKHCHLPLMDACTNVAKAVADAKASAITFASIAKLFKQLGPHPLKEAVEVEAKPPPRRTHYVTREVYDAVRESISGRWTDLCRGEYGDPCPVCKAVGEGCDNCPLELDGQGCDEGSWYMEWSDAGAEYNTDSKQAMAAAERMRTYLVDLLGRLVVKEEKGRRWVMVRVSAELLAQWFTKGMQAVTAEGLPEDAKLAMCGWDNMRRCAVLYFEHPSFAPHYVAPEVVPVFTALQEPEVDAVPTVKAWVLGGIGSYRDVAYGAAFSYSADGARQTFRAQGFTEVDHRPVVEVRLPKYIGDYEKGGE